MQIKPAILVPLAGALVMMTPAWSPLSLFQPGVVMAQGKGDRGGERGADRSSAQGERGNPSPTASPRMRDGGDGPRVRGDGDGPRVRRDGDGPRVRIDGDGPRVRRDGDGPRVRIDRDDGPRVHRYGNWRGDHIRRRGVRHNWGPGVSFYFYDGYYYGDCSWLRRRAIETGSRYWWRRFRQCRDYNW